MGYRYEADQELTRKQAFEATKNQKSNWRKVIDRMELSNNPYLGKRLTVKWVNPNNEVFVGNETYDGGKVHYYFKSLKSEKYYYFSTEIKARNFAKKWMKKHPRG